MSTELSIPNNGASTRQILTEGVISRQAQEVQAAMVIAKRFPRDQTAAFHRILGACKRKLLAEQSMYAYPKGDKVITGASIRLAEAMAQNWGNLSFGIVELEQRAGESTALAYCWDLETNVRCDKVFTIKHWRHTKKGDYALTDPREIYENVANSGARRLRACILGIIPGDVVDAALDECEKTLKGANKEPLVDRLRAMVGKFGEVGVTQEMIENRLGHRLEATIEAELVGLRKVYHSLRDNMSRREDFFELPQNEQSSAGQPPTERTNLRTPTPAPTQREDVPAPTPEDLEREDLVRRVSEAIAQAVDAQELKDGPGAELVRHRDWLGQAHGPLVAQYQARLDQLTPPVTAAAAAARSARRQTPAF